MENQNNTPFHLAIFSPEGPQTLWAERLDSDDAKNYFCALAVEYRGVPIHDKLMSWSHGVEKLDYVNDAAEKRKYATSFYEGGLLALRAIEAIRGTDFLGKLADVPLDTDNIQGFANNEYDKQRYIAVSALNDGVQYFEKLKAYYEDILVSWRDLAGREECYHRFLCYGFGFVMHIGARAIKKDELAAMQNWLDTKAETYDWSTEAQTLFDNPAAS